jgi:hypothetical protein
MVTQVGYSVTSRSRDRVAPCVVCIVHVKTWNADFFVEPQNQGRSFLSGLVSKPVTTVFSCLASKPMATVFSDLASKPAAVVSWLSLKT